MVEEMRKEGNKLLNACVGACEWTDGFLFLAGLKAVNIWVWSPVKKAAADGGSHGGHR